MSIITEGMKHRERIVKYAIKVNNNAAAARRYHKSRQYVQRWRQRYDGSIESLRKKSTRPKSHPNQHTQDELNLIKHMHRHHRHRGLAHVYRKCKDEGYTRSYDSMCRQIRKMGLGKPSKAKKKRKKQKEKSKYTHPGQLVQIDVKYVPVNSIGFVSHHKRYYQITAIDAYSRKRVLSLMNENSTYTTSEFVLTLEEEMGFKIDKIQTDNGKEFTNDPQETDKKSRFQKILNFLDIDYQTTAPYCPWQNGLVERSHREDETRFYSRRRFSSEEELEKALRRYNTSYNNTYRKILNFKNPNEVVAEFFEKAG
ncbi:IS481 family transposase [Suicoccus acidiformans]|uniref:IS481 family transposase n=1 Tax=Suicoccus acidiformans TaxID=2036206 RepID=A0A347WJ32_9LACT|nr:DDE-type integrase/transposase/recombinase [Suicoccus acidiformans]AXY25089.1 IS481 family transposase [Suicoccus acidiformans]